MRLLRGSPERCLTPALPATLEDARAAVGGVIRVVGAQLIDATGLARNEWWDALPLVPAAGVTTTGATVSLGAAF